MKEANGPFVISIAAVSGGGKTAVTTHLVKKLQNSKVLHFDNYDFNGPDDIISWVDNGANYNEWDLTPLIRDLQKLFKENLDYIIIDYPFAYKNAQISKLIDVAIFLDTPLDIALARRVTRDFMKSSLADILAEMKNYISQGRRGYTEMIKIIKPNSDFIIDGTLSVDEISSTIVEIIEERKDRII
ncbi:hypothetical protein [Amphibacillus cookii]|uniref:hypothetical protein n=1 Tax=Amphibacillus cookii TaxID=767787 RepID=UPI00195BB119|nr:hypothetical protein [Amphibacillus cookii]MBM7540196.1 uridine kinase [Amphibacillus cookii]